MREKKGGAGKFESTLLKTINNWYYQRNYYALMTITNVKFSKSLFIVLSKQLVILGTWFSNLIFPLICKYVLYFSTTAVWFCQDCSIACPDQGNKWHNTAVISWPSLILVHLTYLPWQLLPYLNMPPLTPNLSILLFYLSLTAHSDPSKSISSDNPWIWKTDILKHGFSSLSQTLFLDILLNDHLCILTHKFKPSALSHSELLDLEL